MALINPLLILTNKQDTTADLVILEAGRRNLPCLRLNTEDLPLIRPTCAVGTGTSVEFSLGTRDFRLAGHAGVWFRRPEPPRSPQWEPATANVVAAQWQDFVEGLEAVQGPRWMSRPTAIRTAENKILQLAYARRVGFAIPETCITSDDATLRDFQSKHPRIVAKALSGALFETTPDPRFAYTIEVTASNAPHAEELHAAPVVFQELLAPAVHYRVTVVADRVFAARVAPAPGGTIDWRQSPTPPELTRVEVSSEVATRARRLVQSLGLSFSSMDLIEANGTMYFVDLNPNGEWGWLERGAGLPIAQAIVDALAAA